MYYKISDFISNWAYESEAALKVFNNLTDESLNKNVGDNIRTAGRLAWHITTSVIQMSHRTGLTFEAVDENSPVPATAEYLKSVLYWLRQKY